ncbi:MAG: YihY/virulence factor BrkB family protein [Terriglobales bacterium]
MHIRTTKETLVRTVADVQNNHTLVMAAGLSYYFVMALFPTLIVAATVLAYLPGDLFDRILRAAALVVPHEGMGLVWAIVSDVITPRKGALLSVGLLGGVWTVSSGFAALIEALDVAYDVPETRSWWEQRVLAMGMAVVVGLLTVVALAVILVGPRFGDWLIGRGVGLQFGIAWPAIRWTVAIAFTVLAVELMYFLLPNVKQSFKQSLPGAFVAVGAWMALSFGLGIYFRHFAHFNKTYGTLGAGIALMVWLYWSGFAILLGGEINSEAIQVTHQGKLVLKKPPPHKVFPKEPPKDVDEIAAA